MTKSTLSAMEQRICDWLVMNFETKLKDHFLADLSWAVDSVESSTVLKEIWQAEQEFGYANTRPQAIANFFTKRIGKRVYDILPDDIKNYVIANSL
jgi:hypothetical protein